MLAVEASRVARRANTGRRRDAELVRLGACLHNQSMSKFLVER
jgi:hypothetical protein